MRNIYYWAVRLGAPAGSKVGKLFGVDCSIMFELYTSLVNCVV
jgi:hypothetical protein